MVAPVSGRVDVRRAERVVEFPRGGWLGIYSADAPDSIRGEAFDLVIEDEASRISEEAHSDAIMPTLADRNGRAMLISTPKGRNWFWREYQRGLAMTDECASFTAPSSANPNPNIRAAAERARGLVSDRTYRQEWLAEFVDDGGGVFRNVRARATAEPQPQAIAGHQYVFGVDWARSNDFTVIYVVDATMRAAASIDRFSGIGYELQLGRLRAMYDRFKPDTIIAEENSMGGPLVERLQAADLPVRGFTTTNASKAMVIDALALAFETPPESGGVTITNDPVVIGELEAYEQERLPGGMMRYGAPAGMHDDTVMALALAWHGATQAAQVYL
jgi:phage terminase large subunit-like protein